MFFFFWIILRSAEEKERKSGDVTVAKPAAVLVPNKWQLTLFRTMLEHIHLAYIQIWSIDVIKKLPVAALIYDL
jgi:hypothetical protein